MHIDINKDELAMCKLLREIKEQLQDGIRQHADGLSKINREQVRRLLWDIGTTELSIRGG